MLILTVTQDYVGVRDGLFVFESDASESFCIDDCDAYLESHTQQTDITHHPRNQVLVEPLNAQGS